jgi:hypothetical protein
VVPKFAALIPVMDIAVIEAQRTALNVIAKLCFTDYTVLIPDIVMSNNTGPKYGSEGEESYVRTTDAESHCCLVG